MSAAAGFNAERLRAIQARFEALAAAEAAIAAERNKLIAELCWTANGTETEAVPLLNSGVARRLTGWSHTKLTALARAHPEWAWKTDSGAWAFDRAKLLAYLHTPRAAQSPVEK